MQKRGKDHMTLRKKSLRLAPMLVLAVLIAGCAPDPFGRGIGPATTSQERISLLRGQVAANSGDLDALTKLGREYARQGQWERSAGAYREALVVSAGHRPALMGFSAAQSALGNYAVALAHADRAGGGQTQPDAHILRGVALAGQRRMAESRAAFDAAGRAAPRDLDARNNLALSLALAGDPVGYTVIRNVAFAPNADLRHRRNLFLVASILGMEGNAMREAGALGVSTSDADRIFAIGRQARGQGMQAFGLATIL